MRAQPKSLQDILHTGLLNDHVSVKNIMALRSTSRQSRNALKNSFRVFGGKSPSPDVQRFVLLVQRLMTFCADVNEFLIGVGSMSLAQQHRLLREYCIEHRKKYHIRNLVDTSTSHKGFYNWSVAIASKIPGMGHVDVSVEMLRKTGEWFRATPETRAEFSLDGLNKRFSKLDRYAIWVGNSSLRFDKRTLISPAGQVYLYTTKVVNSLRNIHAGQTLRQFAYDMEYLRANLLPFFRVAILEQPPLDPYDSPWYRYQHHNKNYSSIYSNTVRSFIKSLHPTWEIDSTDWWKNKKMNIRRRF